jgi:hypothetical protein
MNTKKASPLGELLNRLSERDAIEIALKYLYMYLPRFEFYHPHDIWVRRVLNIFENGQKFEWTDPSLLGIEHRWDRLFKPPGSDPFIQGVYYLLDVIEHPDDPLCRVQSVGSSIYGIVEETWARDYPYRWMTYQHFMFHREEIVKEMDEAIIFWMHKVHLYEPIIIELEQKLWTDVGNELEKRLIRNEKMTK